MFEWILFATMVALLAGFAAGLHYVDAAVRFRVNEELSRQQRINQSMQMLEDTWRRPDVPKE